MVFFDKRRPGRCEQVEMISLEDLVPQTHDDRRFVAIWSFKFVEKQLKKIETNPPQYKDMTFFAYLVGVSEGTHKIQVRKKSHFNQLK